MNNLIRLLGRRLIALPIMVIGVTLLVFFVMYLSPIDPAYSALGEFATPEALEQYRIDNGLKDPFLVQYINYLGGMIQGDLGSYGVGSSNRVSDLVGTALPITLQLTFFGLIIAVIFAFPLGIIAAIYRDQWPDQVIRVLSVIFLGTPSFWLASLLVLAFVGGSLPVSGTLPSFTGDFSGWFARMLLPAIALATPVIGQMTRVVRTSMVEELDSDYVRTALGAGIPRSVVIFSKRSAKRAYHPSNGAGLACWLPNRWRSRYRNHLQPAGHGPRTRNRYSGELRDPGTGWRARRCDRVRRTALAPRTRARPVQPVANLC